MLPMPIFSPLADKEGVLHLTLTRLPIIVSNMSWSLEKNEFSFNPILDVNKYDYLITKAADKFKLDSSLIKSGHQSGIQF